MNELQRIKDMWTVYTMCAVQLICINFLLYYLYNVHADEYTFDTFDKPNLQV